MVKNEFDYEFDFNNPLAYIAAFKGGSAPKKSQAQKDAEAAQAKELADLQAKEDARIAAMGRKRRGRASLLSGSEMGDENGLKTNLGG